MPPTLELPASVRDRPCFTQFMGGLSIEPGHFDNYVATVRAMGLPAIWEANEKAGPQSLFNPRILSIANALHIAGESVEQAAADKESASEYADHDVPAYVIVGGTAIIPVAGPLSKQPSSLQSIFGGSSTVGMRKALGLAMTDSRVQRVMFHIDSPGGTVAGTGDLADDIYAASAKKPIGAYIEDWGTSAAYKIASQVGKIYASPYANIGSIGTIWTVYDTSEAYKKDGIKVHAVMSSPGKAFYVDGLPITKEQLAKIQAHVDDAHRNFLEVVARGRGVTPAQARIMAGDADIYNTHTALEKGLIDAVCSFRASLKDFAANGKEQAMRASAPVLAIVENIRGPAALPALAAGMAANLVPGASEAVDGPTNTPRGIVPSEDPQMPPDPPKSKPDEAEEPVVLTPTAHQKLVADAAKGAEAYTIVLAMQKKSEQDAKAALDLERERLIAAHPLITKEDVAACADMASLKALERTAVRAAQAQRTPADPKSGSGGKPEPSEEEKAAAEIEELKAAQAARFKASMEA